MAVLSPVPLRMRDVLWPDHHAVIGRGATTRLWTDARDTLTPRASWQTAAMAPRFLTLADVTEELNISAAQAYALVRSGELPAIQVGGRGQWRVEAAQLEAYIERMYAQTRSRVESGELERGHGADRRA